MFLNIAIAIAASLLFLGLLLLKIAVSVSTLLLFVGMPMAIVVWPVAPWVTRVAMRAFAVCLRRSVRVGAVLRRVGGDQRERAELQGRRRGDGQAAAAAGGDRAAVA